jgi:actin-related protein
MQEEVNYPLAVYLSAQCPGVFSQGEVSDWSMDEALWRHDVFGKVKVDPCSQPVFVVLSSQNRQERGKMAELLFSRLRVPALYITHQAWMGACAVGSCMSGVVITCGHEATHVAVVHKGRYAPSSILPLPLGGSALTDYLTMLLTERGLYLHHSKSEKDVVQRAKERLCFVAYDFDQAMKEPDVAFEKTLRMPDGQEFVVSKERFRCPEGLFQPALLGKECDSLQQAIVSAIRRRGPDTQRVLYQNIVLAGGSTLFHGFKERLEKELAALAPPGTEVRVIAPKHRQYSAWMEGRVVASVPDFHTSRFVSKQECDHEDIPGVLDNKCI